MKRLLTTALAIAFVATAAAQSTPQGANTLPPVQPPPDMDAPAATPAPASLTPLGNSDAEAQAAAAAEAQATSERAKALSSPDFTKTAPPPKPLDSPGLPPDVQQAAEATELPVVTVRQNGNERVEEYRKKGVLYFVRVVPQEGPPRYYVDNVSNVPPDLRHLTMPSGVVEPVYYRLFEWK